MGCQGAAGLGLNDKFRSRFAKGSLMLHTGSAESRDVTVLHPSPGRACVSAGDIKPRTCLLCPPLSPDIDGHLVLWTPHFFFIGDSVFGCFVPSASYSSKWSLQDREPTGRCGEGGESSQEASVRDREPSSSFCCVFLGFSVQFLHSVKCSEK